MLSNTIIVLILSFNTIIDTGASHTIISPDIVSSIGISASPLDKFITNITYGVILTGENRKFKDSGVHYISSTTVTETGINHFFINSQSLNQICHRNSPD